MNMKIITMVLVISQLIIVSKSSYYYAFFKIDKSCGSYEEGQKICEDAGGELAVIKSKHDLSKACAVVDGGAHYHYMIDAYRTSATEWHKLSDNSFFLFDFSSPLWDKPTHPSFDISKKYVGVTSNKDCKLHSLDLYELKKSGVLCQIKEEGRNCIPGENPLERVCGIDLRGTLANSIQLLPQNIQIYNVFEFSFEAQSAQNTILRVDLLNHEMESVWNFAIKFQLKKFFIEYNLEPTWSGTYFPFEIQTHYIIQLYFLPTRICIILYDKYYNQIGILYADIVHNEIKQVKKIKFTGKSDEDCANIYVCDIKYFCRTPSPTDSPSTSPTRYPSESPSYSPTRYPSESPSYSPTRYPSESPSYSPTRYPSESPSYSPTFYPSRYPSVSPTRYPSRYPSVSPTKYPSETPTYSPTHYPTRSPTYEEECIPYCWIFDPYICKDPRRTNTEICGADNSFESNKLRMILALSQANRMYGKCKGLCVYSLVNPNKLAFKWDANNYCWNVVQPYEQECYITNHNEFKHVLYLWEHGCYECHNIILKLKPCDDSEKRSNFVDCDTGELSIGLYLGQANGYYKDCDCQCVHTYPSKIPYQWNPTGKCWQKATYGQCVDSIETEAVEQREEEICEKKEYPFFKEHVEPISYLSDQKITQNQNQEQQQQQQQQQEQENAETFPKSYPLNVKYLILSIIFIVFAVVGVKLYQNNDQKKLFPHETTPLMELVNKY